MARGFKFRILEFRILEFIRGVAKTKGVDQLRGWSAFCFHIMQKAGFLMTQLMLSHYNPPCFNTALDIMWSVFKSKMASFQLFN